ncbi:uncharacterized protein LOC143026544 [Oratosquilla oratoria]|uniref:uncharacterized protein LOC143026544 n=1 Tax=Oratosquilla oratoria TaxID=337810 RepID=UPI003F777419
MREIPLSTCHRAGVQECIKKGIRQDGREFLEVRPVDINFGKDYGSCTVMLGATRVLGQVTGEVVEPRASRPNEGKIQIFVHLSPMSAPQFEPGRANDLVDELQQILERNVKDSRCIDVEALCILAEESVWQLRVDLTVLNHAGNLTDACNIAAVSALRHFHRPEVTVEEDGQVTIHSLEEREPIPTFLKKIPVCLTYAFFVLDDDCFMLMDPTDLEERVMSGKLVVGLNPHGEITSLLFPGKVALTKQQVLNCVQNAFTKAKATAELVQKKVEDDIEERKSIIRPEGFTKVLRGYGEYILQRSQKLIESNTWVPVKKEEQNGMSDKMADVQIASMEGMDDGEDDDNDNDVQMNDEGALDHMNIAGAPGQTVRGGPSFAQALGKNVNRNPAVVKVEGDSSEEEEETKRLTASDFM